MLLLLGCANVANLLVVRAARREHEIAVRKALGASRFRLLQLQMIESWLLSVAGAALGLVLAVYLKQVIERLLFPTPPGMSFTVPMDMRVFAWTLSLLAALGFVLAALGLYGLIAQTTIERRREFGIRLALGAAGSDIVRLVARYAVLVASIGIFIGLSLSYFGTRLIQTMLFGVSPLDPAVHVVAVITLTVVVAVACVAPAWRAVRMEPVEVLRAE